MSRWAEAFAALSGGADKSDISRQIVGTTGHVSRSVHSVMAAPEPMLTPDPERAVDICYESDVYESDVKDDVPVPPDPTWWRDEFEERAAHWEFGGNRSREEAEALAWGELENRWNIEHGERVSRGVCAGCRRPIGEAPALDLIDGNRVHDTAGHGCLIQYGDRWRGAATRALMEMGLVRPEK
jgi:hypothetical protein